MTGAQNYNSPVHFTANQRVRYLIVSRGFDHPYEVIKARARVKSPPREAGNKTDSVSGKPTPLGYHIINACREIRLAPAPLAIAIPAVASGVVNTRTSMGSIAFSVQFLSYRIARLIIY